MGTRCQIQVIQEGLDWKEKVTLYHHFDGYPENIIPLINKALQGHIKRQDERAVRWNDKSDQIGKPRWEAGRAGKVASMLCWADPEQFEPEAGHKLHGDIEYYYKLHVVNHSGGSITDSPTWLVEVFTVNFDGDLKTLHTKQTIEELLEYYPNIHSDHEVK